MDAREIIKNNPGLGRRALGLIYPEVGQGVFRRVLREIAAETPLENMDSDTLVKLQQQKQAAQDRARIANRILREKNRESSIIEELNREFKEMFSKIDLPVKVEHEFHGRIDGGSLVIGIADLHSQEVIAEKYNLFNPVVLGQRLQKYAHKILDMARHKKVKEIVVCGLSDLIGSDRRKSEIMVNATNRTRASIMAATLLEQFILDLYAEYPVRVAFAYGNESRVSDEVGYEDALLSDNFDFAIYNMLKLMFRNTDIVFEDGRGTDQVIEVGDFNILITHGDSNGFSQDPTKGVNFKKLQYANMGIIIDYVLFGHLHGCNLQDGFARSGSMCGGNAYAHGLGYSTRASQNIFHVSDAIEGMRIDLQDASAYTGYPVDPNILGYIPK